MVLALGAGSGQTSDGTVHLTGRIVDEGGDAIPSAVVQLDGQSKQVTLDGEFDIALSDDAPNPSRLDVSAEGYYPNIQSLHYSDFDTSAAAKFPAIELVRKKNGRRLLMFAGDAMLSRRYFAPRDGEPVLVRKTHIAQDSQALLQHVRPYIELADYASVNLETQLSTAVLDDPLPKSVTFYSPPELAGSLRWAGFDYVALGNNHMFDFRDVGLRSTIAALNSAGLNYSGGGIDEAQARRPAAMTIGGLSHAYLSYVGWAGTFSPSQVAEPNKGGAALGVSRVIGEDLQKIPRDTTTVLQVHTGLEYMARPAMSKRTMLRQAVLDGADVALGHHSHVLQGFEVYNDKLIAYSLGNFLFDQYHYTTQLGMLLYVWMDGDRLHRAEVVPLHINGYVPTPAIGAFRYSVLNRLAALSDPSSVCMKPSGVHAVVRGCDDEVPRQQNIGLDGLRHSGVPIPLRQLGASPLAAVSIAKQQRTYRLGGDILQRGDFEYVGLYETQDRSWIEDERSSIRTVEKKALRIKLAAGDKLARTGMKVFERVFTASNPATVSGRIKVAGDVRLRLLLQRRRIDDAFEDALVSGPTTIIGTADFSSDGWVDFVFDYNQPRIATRSLRLLFEIEDLSRTSNGAEVELDDLAWVEWHTPWIAAGDDAAAMFATHLQFQ